MPRSPSFAELSRDGETLRIHGHGTPGLCLTDGQIDGWWGTPDPKWSLTERQSADGAHAVMDEMALYSARTVTFDVVAIAADRAGVKELRDGVLSMAHGLVRLRVVDESEDTFCDGLLSVKADPKWLDASARMTLALTCPDPRRLATAAESAVMLPASASLTAGLSYGEGGGGLAYPLSYGEGALDARNVCCVTNHGTSTAWPVLRVSRGMSDVEVRATCAGASSTLALAGTCTTEVTIDCRARTAETAQTDVTRRLTGAGALAVPPGQTMRLTLATPGNGSVTVELRDTYI